MMMADPCSCWLSNVYVEFFGQVVMIDFDAIFENSQKTRTDQWIITLCNKCRDHRSGCTT